MNTKLYHAASLGKFVLGAGILLIDYTAINVYEDPTIAIGLGFLGLFIASRGGSFYLFLWIQKLYRHVDPLNLVKDSYKLSLLFGIFVIINALLLLSGYWSKLLGLILLAGFVALQISLFSDKKQAHGHAEKF